jgi:hypothetical protein
MVLEHPLKTFHLALDAVLHNDWGSMKFLL